MALLTMAAIAVLVALGAIVPQRLSTPPAEFAAWVQRSSIISGVARALGLTDVYHAPLFLGVAGLFTLNLMLCTVKQGSKAWRRYRSRLPVLATERRPEAGDRFVVSPADYTSTGGSVVTWLEREGYAVRSLGPGQWEGRRRWFGHLILPGFHVGLVLVIAGALAVSLFSFRGYVELAEGQGFENTPEQLLSTSYGPLAGKPSGEFAMRLDAFRVAYHQNGQVAVRESDVTFFHDQGETPTVIASSHPHSMEGYRVYQTVSFGWAPHLRMAFVGGNTAEGFVNIGKDGQSGLTLPGSSLKAEFRLDETRSDAGVSPGLLQAKVSKTGGGVVFEGQLQPGAAADLGDGTSLTYLDLRRWTGVSIVRTPGLWVVYLGGSFALLALLLHFLVVPDRLHVLALGGERGPGYAVTGHRWRYQGSYGDRLDALAERLGAKLADLPDGTERRVPERLA